MIKILAITDGVGSNYHRVQLPLKYINTNEFDITLRELQTGPLQDADVEGYDILFFNWTISMLPNHLALLQKKHGFKIVMDMDDHWDISKNHPSYNAVLQYVPRMKEYLVLADYLICTTEALKEKLLKYNKNVTVIPNRIPYGDLQFNVEPAKKRDKIRIGFIGSISHLPDWTSIKNDIDRMVNDKKIMDNCEFVVCGYNDVNDYSKKVWMKIIDLFKGKAKVFRTRDIHSYMHLYNEADIVLAPLVDNFQNKAKSELKVLETACKGAIILGSKMYKDKLSVPGLMFTDDDASYYKWIKNFVDNKEQLPELIQNRCDRIMHSHPFQPVVEARQNLFKQIKNGL
jgi:glycosyltransferase involved in cell wall biosynthesis